MNHLNNLGEDQLVTGKRWPTLFVLRLVEEP